MQNEITGDITPLPWRIEDDYVIISDSKQAFDEEVASTTSEYNLLEKEKANAAYIVKACNLFPELVEALEEMTKIISDSKYGDIWLNKFDWDNIAKAKTLIKKAKQ
jgi:hypothetical protein